MTKIFFGLILILFGGLVGYFVFMSQNPAFAELEPQEMHDQIIAERDYAIAEAVKDGDYHCCIEPPCTMCYMEANEWNNHTAGTCACDDLIAQGKEACPQCHRGLGLNGEGATCDSGPLE